MRGAVISMGSLSSKWTVKAMKNYFESVDHLSIKSIEVKIGDKKYEVLYNGQPIGEYDCIYAKGSFRYANLLRTTAHALSPTTYMPVQARAFTIGHDKLLSHLKLNDAKIPTPTTYMSSSTEAAKKILQRISFPVIMKFPHGTHGKGVMFADSFESASSMLDALSVLNQPFIIQEYIETGGLDTRAIVVGNKVVAAMRRKAVQGEKRANIHAGGKGEPVELDAHTKKIAIRAAEAIGADICAVDILEGARGPVVIEINLSPGLQGITNATKIDVADKIAKFLAKKTKEFTSKGKETGAKDVMKELGIETTSGEEIKAKQIITNLKFRGSNILIPEVVTKMTDFKETDEFVVRVEDGKLTMEKVADMEPEKKKK